MTDIVTIKPTKVTYGLAISFRSGDHTNSVRFETESAPAQFSVGDRIWIASLDGFPESRPTTGVVRAVKHTLSGNALDLIHDITIEIEEKDQSIRT